MDAEAVSRFGNVPEWEETAAFLESISSSNHVQLSASLEVAHSFCGDHLSSHLQVALLRAFFGFDFISRLDGHRVSLRVSRDQPPIPPPASVSFQEFENIDESAQPAQLAASPPAWLTPVRDLGARADAASADSGRGSSAGPAPAAAAAAQRRSASAAGFPEPRRTRAPGCSPERPRRYVAAPRRPSAPPL